MAARWSTIIVARWILFLAGVGISVAYSSAYEQTETAIEDTNTNATAKTVTIVQGAQFEDHTGPDYDLPVITVKPGAKVIWKNEDYPDKTDPYASDTTRHSATSGVDALPDGWFMTDILQSGNSSKSIEMPRTPEYILTFAFSILTGLMER
jgi:hypothetical protein